MNILPKKRWHVRTKDNIARVRKDEAAAREEEEKRKKQLETAESEARLNFLRKQKGMPTSNVEKDDTEKATTGDEKLEHVDVFADYKSHIKTTSKELAKEKKEEQEKYEKQIGYLTYLGQDTNEALKVRSWYEVAPKRRRLDDDTETNEKELKLKHNHDPLTLMKALLPPDKNDSKPKKLPIEFVKETTCESIEKLSGKSHKKSKRHKEKHKKSSKKKHSRHRKEEERESQKKQLLQRLRKERLQREAVERARQEELLAPKEVALNVSDKMATGSTSTVATPRVKQKYNSQFNPEIAKQNM